MGLLPHTSPQAVYASEYYKEDFLRYRERLGVDGIEFRKMLPALYIPTYLRNTLGYRTAAMVSMPVLNPHTCVNRDFDAYELMPTHNDMAAMLEKLTFSDERPSFYLLNVGETHYPYALPDEDPSEWPRDLRRARSLQAARRRPRRRRLARVLRRRRRCASCMTARSAPSSTSTASSRGSSTRCPRTRG